MGMNMTHAITMAKSQALSNFYCPIAMVLYNDIITNQSGNYIYFTIYNLTLIHDPPPATDSSHLVFFSLSYT
jgi:hypothetical protein